MRRGRVFFYLAFILILGLVAVVVVRQRFLRPVQAVAQTPGTNPPAASSAQTTSIVVTTQKVARGSILDEIVLGTVPVQQNLVMQGMMSDLSLAVGRQVKFDLDSGIPLTESMLVNSDEQLSSTGSNAALSIPKGMVAVSIPISRLSSVSYAPQPGDHVNLIVTLMFVDLDTDFQSILPNKTGTVIAPGPAGETGPDMLTVTISDGGGKQGRAEIDPVLGQSVYLVPSETQRPRMASQTLLQDAVVLQMGNFPLEGAAQAQEPAGQEQAAAETEGEEGQDQAPAANVPEVVTLIVSPQDAITLNYLIYSGAKMSLALRSAGDDSRVQTEAVTLQFLLDQYRIPVPVKLPYGLEPRVDGFVEPTAVPEDTAQNP